MYRQFIPYNYNYYGWGQPASRQHHNLRSTRAPISRDSNEDGVAGMTGTSCTFNDVRGISTERGHAGVVGTERKDPGFYFKNETNETVQVAISYRSNKCGGDGWRNVGWFILNPGEERWVLKKDVKGENLYYYAETPDLTFTWEPIEGEDKFPVWVEYGKFDNCEVLPGDLGVTVSSPPPGKRVNMIQTYATNKDKTVRLTY
ncbi:hypothetical protein AF332_00220 [Sporosarcina globispora]|uniref:Uncharacterized protein n=1 Tax=Sporosarcina globispora TaxID=1459 RepID=A0A0M0G6F2_SPOGL|nr:DUF1036 domain-containing protein [Sporosarcina globispora]KON85450.1 hypothetical protein AF332_00220 [Sporosarcina globispora]